MEEACATQSAQSSLVESEGRAGLEEIAVMAVPELRQAGSESGGRRQEVVPSRPAGKPSRSFFPQPLPPTHKPHKGPSLDGPKLRLPIRSSQWMYTRLCAPVGPWWIADGESRYRQSTFECLSRQFFGFQRHRLEMDKSCSVSWPMPRSRDTI